MGLSIRTSRCQENIEASVSSSPNACTLESLHRRPGSIGKGKKKQYEATAFFSQW